MPTSNTEKKAKDISKNSLKVLTRGSSKNTNMTSKQLAFVELDSYQDADIQLDRFLASLSSKVENLSTDKQIRFAGTCLAGLIAGPVVKGLENLIESFVSKPHTQYNVITLNLLRKITRNTNCLVQLAKLAQVLSLNLEQVINKDIQTIENQLLKLNKHIRTSFKLDFNYDINSNLIYTALEIFDSLFTIIIYLIEAIKLQDKKLILAYTQALSYLALNSNKCLYQWFNQQNIVNLSVSHLQNVKFELLNNEYKYQQQALKFLEKVSLKYEQSHEFARQVFVSLDYIKDLNSQIDQYSFLRNAQRVGFVSGILEDLQFEFNTALEKLNV